MSTSEAVSPEPIACSALFASPAPDSGVVMPAAVTGPISEDRPYKSEFRQDLENFF